MKKVLAMCIAASFLATACKWFRHEPKKDPLVVTQNDSSDSVTTDTSLTKKDNIMVMKDSSKNAGKKI